jgi:hypothetical protein
MLNFQKPSKRYVKTHVKLCKRQEAERKCVIFDDKCEKYVIFFELCVKLCLKQCIFVR